MVYNVLCVSKICEKNKDSSVKKKKKHCTFRKQLLEKFSVQVK